MAKLTSGARKRLPSSDFVFPGTRKYPIPDRSHAANAKARAAHQGGAIERAVDARVDAKYPDMGKKKRGLRAAATRAYGR